MTIVSAEILRELGTFDTPTICNAIEVVDPERRNRGFSTRPFFLRSSGFTNRCRIRENSPYKITTQANERRRCDWLL